MSFFGVTIETIETVVNHPNADRLSVARLKGLDFQFVVGRDSYEVNEKVLYFPIDSIIPLHILELFGLVKDGKGVLAGKQGNRVKTKDIRGILSRGIVAKLHHADGFDSRDGSDLTKHFGVEKYEPLCVLEKGANLLPLPQHVQDIVGTRYDIESTDRHAGVVDALMDVEVYVTEKLEGQNLSVTATPQGELFVNQRNYTIKQIDGHTHSFWKVSESEGIIAAAKTMCEKSNLPVTIFGEFIGPSVQDNIYQLKKHEIRVFDIAVGNSFLDFVPLETACGNTYNLKMVPVIYTGKLRDFLNGKTIKDVSGGKSVLFDTLREGVVIKSQREMVIPFFGRAIIKKRDEKYESVRG